MLERIAHHGLRPTVPSICSVMDAWCEVNQVGRAHELAECAIRDGLVSASETMYNTLIKGYARCRCKRARGECGCTPCQCCRPERGLEIMQEMAKLGLKPDTVTINTLLDSHCSAGHLQQASLLEPRDTPLDLVTHHLASPHLTSPHLTSPHLAPPRLQGMAPA